MEHSEVIDLRAFVPAKDQDISKQFYQDLGFTLNWSGEKIAELQVGDHRFLLQEFFVEQHAHNFMMQLMVADTDAWWKHIAERPT